MTSRSEKNRNLRVNRLKLNLGLLMTLIILVLGLYAVDEARAREFANHNGRILFISRHNRIFYIELFGNAHEIDSKEIANEVSNLLDRVQSTFKK